MKIPRATFPTPEARSSFIGGDIERKLNVDFGDRTVTGFLARYDEVDPVTKISHRLVSTPFTITMTQDEYNAIAPLFAALLSRAGVVPAGSTWSIVDVPTAPGI